MQKYILIFFCLTTLFLRAQEPQKNNALIPLPKIENDAYDWYQRHNQILKANKTNKPDLIFIGDSITHFFGGIPAASIVRGKATWDKYYSHRNALNLGFGWDRVQNVLWRIENGELDNISPKVVVILIGTNNLADTKNARLNTPAEIAAGITAVCEQIRGRLPATKILLLGVLPRSPKKFVAPIKEINSLIAILGKEEYITFLNLHDQFSDEKGLPKKELLTDTVHPNPAGYQLWAETIEPTLSKLLNDRPVKSTE